MNLTDIDVDADETVKAWKAPGAGRGGPAGHPAGQIRLSAPRRLGRRAELLAGPERGRNEDTVIPTITTVTAGLQSA
ncbi:hypothetical protein KDK95_11535 [Actinospica sp. MGRD01-02]|uniref:Uncharacterized protein n=1 Tax=Actinospica acidithermotolerans TaxID=2828514 RepID=A0A941E9A5_9ACTN|nr:hypothetical protein [Actinospica acidithermotolerans]MBR7826937.1 hypothetical protein [Actinospica acidithermotolerans]